MVALAPLSCCALACETHQTVPHGPVFSSRSPFRLARVHSQTTHHRDPRSIVPFYGRPMVQKVVAHPHCIDKKGVPRSALRAAFPDPEEPIPILQIKIPPFGANSVNPSVNLPFASSNLRMSQ